MLVAQRLAQRSPVLSGPLSMKTGAGVYKVSPAPR